MNPTTEAKKPKYSRQLVCSVPECGTDKKLRPNVGFFQLPKNPERAKLWLKNLCLPNTDTSAVVVCEEHFENSALSNSSPFKRQLTRDALPILKLPPHQKFVNLSDGNSKPRDQINKTDTETLQVTQTQEQGKTVAVTKKCFVIESGPPEIIRGASAFTYHIHTIQDKMQQLSNSRKEYIQLSLKLYLRYPNVYKHLHKALALPPKSELKDVFKNALISTERATLFLIYLCHKVNTMKVKQKQCFISICETKIKPRIYYDIKKDHFLGIHDFDDVLKPQLATTAVVLMAQGIFEEWKQPVAVGYLADNSPSIKPWVSKNIKNLFEIGLNVRAVVYHKESEHFTNNRLFYSLNNKKKVFCIQDVSSLFTSFYFNFTKCDYCLNNAVAKIEHIADYHNLDCKKKIPLTPKLTAEHINPTNLKKLNIKSVMEVFSMTTAAAMSAYIDFNMLAESARNTVVLITKMSKLYDILNTGQSDGEGIKKGFTCEETELHFLTEMLDLFDNLSIVMPVIKSSSSWDKSHKDLMEKFKIHIRSILALWEVLKNENYDDLPVWRFTTTASDLFHDQVQKHSKSITKPTAREVNSIFRQTAVIHLLKNTVKDFSPNQMQSVLTEFQIIIKGFKLLDEEYASHNLDATNYCISSSEYNALEIERKDAIIFLAGFLLKKCTEVHKCEELKKYNSITATNLDTLSMCESIIDESWKNNCVLPRAQFVEFVESMEIIFRMFMNKEILSVMIDKKILSSLMKSLDFVHIPNMLCKCFPVVYVKKLYARFRIYHTLKYNNELIKTKRNGRIVVNKL